MKKICGLLILAMLMAMLLGCNMMGSSLSVYFGTAPSSKSMASARTLGSPNTTTPQAGQAIVFDNTNPGNPVATAGVDLSSLTWSSTAGSGTNANHLAFHAWLELWNTDNGFLNFGGQTTSSGGGFSTYAISFDFASADGASIGDSTLQSDTSYPYGYLEADGVSTSNGSIGQSGIPGNFFYPGSPSAGQAIIFFAGTMADARALYTQEHTTNQLITPGSGLCICIVVPGMTPINGSSSGPVTASFDINTAAILDSNGNLVNGWWNNISFTHN